MTSITNKYSLKNRYALITGASGHIGKTCCKTLLELEANLIVVDKRFDKIIEKEIIKQKNYQKIIKIECDLENEKDRKDLIKCVYKKTSHLSILINNAAFVGSSKIEGWKTNFENQSIITWRRAFEVNLTAVFHLCQKLAPMMQKSKGSSIINIGSIYAHYGPFWSLYKGTKLGNPAAYSASKGGLVQLTRWLATTLAPNIRVNGISPGGIFRNQPKTFVKKYSDQTPLKRMGKEKDLTGAFIYLATDMSEYVTGQILKVDGGYSAW